jgi:hypothetical protein
LNTASFSRTDARLAPTQVKCEAAALPSARMALHRLQRAVLRGAARAIGDRTELGTQRIQLLAHRAQLFSALGRLGRKKLKTQRQTHMVCLLWFSRHPGFGRRQKIRGCRRRR